MLECDAGWPGVVFNTTCLIGPEDQKLAHLRTEAYPVYLGHRYPRR